MRYKIITLTILLLLTLSGCQTQSNSSSPPPSSSAATQTVKLYYGDTANEKLEFEQRQIKTEKGADKYKVVLTELFKGPQSKELRRNIASGAKVYGTIRQGDRLIVDLNQQFNRFGGSMAEIMGVGSVVNTMTQFPEIKEVKILVEGQEYIGPSGQPRGFMQTFSNP
jgi:spore germination protein GerM